MDAGSGAGGNITELLDTLGEVCEAQSAWSPTCN